MIWPPFWGILPTLCKRNNKVLWHLVFIKELSNLEVCTFFLQIINILERSNDLLQGWVLQKVCKNYPKFLTSVDEKIWKLLNFFSLVTIYLSFIFKLPSIHFLLSKISRTIADSYLHVEFSRSLVKIRIFKEEINKHLFHP